jgi:hypothetical protein
MDPLPVKIELDSEVAMFLATIAEVLGITVDELGNEFLWARAREYENEPGMMLADIVATWPGFETREIALGVAERFNEAVAGAILAQRTVFPMYTAEVAQDEDEPLLRFVASSGRQDIGDK